MKRLILISTVFLSGFWACAPKKTFVANTTVQYLRFSAKDSVQPDATIEAFVLPFRMKMEAEMNATIATAAQELTLGQPTSSLGTWAAETVQSECQKNFGRIDFSSINQHGLRIRSLPKGAISRGKIFELMPFDNQIVILEGDSAVVAQFMNHIASRDGWPLAGATFDIVNKKAQNIKIQGEALRNGRTYRFVQSDYIANGGDGCDFLKNLTRETPNKLLRDVLIEGCLSAQKQGKMLDAPLDNRINVIKK